MNSDTKNAYHAYIIHKTIECATLYLGLIYFTH